MLRTNKQTDKQIASNVLRTPIDRVGVGNKTVLTACDADCRCDHDGARDGAGELFIWSVLFFIDYEINKFTLFMLDHTRVYTQLLSNNGKQA